MGTGGTITLNECIVHGNKAWSMAASGMLSDINVHRELALQTMPITGIAVVVVDNFGKGTRNENFGIENTKCNGFYMNDKPGCQKFSSNECQSTLKNELPLGLQGINTTEDDTALSTSTTVGIVFSVLLVLVGICMMVSRQFYRQSNLAIAATIEEDEKDLSRKVKQEDKTAKTTTRPHVGNETKTPHEQSRMEETYKARWQDVLAQLKLDPFKSAAAGDEVIGDKVNEDKPAGI